MKLQWPDINELPWIYSHNAIFQDIDDSYNICSYSLNILQDKSDLEKQFLKYLIKWFKLVLDNIKYHYQYKHKYYFPICKLDICNDLVQEYNEIDTIIKNIELHMKHLTTDYSTEKELIKNIQQNFTHLEICIRKNFNKEKNELLPDIISKFDYIIFRKLDIKIGLKAKWYCLPHLYRNISKEESKDHINRILKIPKITRDTTIALYFKRYKFEYDHIIAELIPEI